MVLATNCNRLQHAGWPRVFSLYSRGTLRHSDLGRYQHTSWVSTTYAGISVCHGLGMPCTLLLAFQLSQLVSDCTEHRCEFSPCAPARTPAIARSLSVEFATKRLHSALHLLGCALSALLKWLPMMIYILRTTPRLREVMLSAYNACGR